MIVAPAAGTDRRPESSPAWVSDNGDGNFTNPILHADYSDPDVVRVGADASTQFSYSTDGESFTPVGSPFTSRQGGWIGAKVGLFCSRATRSNDSGYADFDWFRISP